MRNQSIVVSFVCLLLAYHGINASTIIDSANQDRLDVLELKTCKKFVNTSDYQQINDVSVYDFLNEIEHDYPDEIRFDVFIRGNEEARIILSENADYDLMEPLYEIVIGGGHNTYTSIYRNKKECLEEVDTPDILWPEQFRKFTIEVTHAGYVRVYVAPYKIAIIEAINLQPIYINYILFSGIKTDNSSIEYYFDCGAPEHDADPPLLAAAPITNTASAHTHTITSVLNVICTYILLQPLIKIIRIR